jgi:GTPase SAR1 family protein
MKSNIFLQLRSTTYIALVGNKCDLLQERQVDRDMFKVFGIIATMHVV